ncbi:MAG: hypothetical protein WD939_07955 [Dehalococcoidia bacterium]
MSDSVAKYACGTLAAVALVAFAWLAIGGLTPTSVAASDALTLSAVDHSLPAAPAQVDDGAGDDTRIPVMLWTLVAAGGAAGLGLILLVVRIGMGWVKPLPPPQEEDAH